MTQEAIKTRKQAKQNCDDSLASSKRVYPNTNETEESNKNINEICKKNDETAPKYVGYVENILQEMKTTERKRISKVDAKQTHLRRVKSESGT